MSRTAVDLVFRRVPATTPLLLSEDIYRKGWSSVYRNPRLVRWWRPKREMFVASTRIRGSCVRITVHVDSDASQFAGQPVTRLVTNQSRNAGARAPAADKINLELLWNCLMFLWLVQS